MAEGSVQPYSLDGKRIIHADGRRGILQDGGPDSSGRVPVLWGVISQRDGEKGNVPKPLITLEDPDLMSGDPERIVPADIVEKRRHGKLTTEEYEEWVAPKEVDLRGASSSLQAVVPKRTTGPANGSAKAKSATKKFGSSATSTTPKSSGASTSKRAKATGSPSSAPTKNGKTGRKSPPS